jgi:hypothetical protein
MLNLGSSICTTSLHHKRISPLLCQEPGKRFSISSRLLLSPKKFSDLRDLRRAVVSFLFASKFRRYFAVVHSLLFSFALSFVPSVVALGQKPSISFDGGTLQLAGRQETAAVILSSSEF